ncbi:MAG: hypothetical protein K9K66_04425 [Desulfarculaceae bacterium]|nr:hypothetical protein [Desulfarculaceae bacterium]MCF8073289.1 hypothetical protein [Desulfarculaceae bacterium]MCF8100885.1 hypothetical protein [Desulfarculaceae bacterium]MCF8116659.1 hypothetical protein [Desulfarculaceae bacterium]
MNNPYATNLLDEAAEFDRLNELDAKKLRQLVIDVENVASNPSGKRVLQHLLDRAHVFQSSMTGNAWTNFLEGERQMGLHLLAMLAMASPAICADVVTDALRNYKEDGDPAPDK